MNGAPQTPETVTLAQYLFRRLHQLGVGSIHGVPGDYNLELLDHVEPAGLLWVGNANELNAGYAADGYARTKGVGALITTFGVGELSAVNAIAGAYTERAAVVHIVGTPMRDAQDGRKMIHHTLGDGNFRHFADMYQHITVAQANLNDPRTAARQVDAVLEQCVLQSRPVYIEVPVDMVAVRIPANGLASKIEISRELPGSAFKDVLAKATERLYTAKHPIIFVDGETRPLNLGPDVQRLIELTKWPTFTSLSGKGLIDMTLPNVYGIYSGSFADKGTQDSFKTSDLILCFGLHPTSTNSYAWTALPNPTVSISFTYGGINIDGKMYRNVGAEAVLQALVAGLDISRINVTDTGLHLPRDRNLPLSQVADNDMIKQDQAWKVLGNFLRPGDIVLGETGTAGYGVREMAFPKHTRLFAPCTWLSIGYMLPASQGAALAQRELIAAKQYHDITDARTVLIIGDGSFQMTAQELGTIIRLGLNVVVFLINNDGYTIERCIHGQDQRYNDVSRWRYLNAPAFFGASENAFTGTAKTYGELKAVLQDKELADGKGLRMVEIHMPPKDAPAGPLLDLLNAQTEAVSDQA
jgi:pyruvate decarboxylase